MSKIKIGVTGLHQSGKSLLINCLFGRNISKVGDGNSTTHTVIKYSFSKDESIIYQERDCGIQEEADISAIHDLCTNKNIDLIQVQLDHPLLKEYIVYDLPGSGYNAEDNATMAKALDELDYAILIATNMREITSASSFYADTLSLLKRKEIPYYFFLNCVKTEYWSPRSQNNRKLLESDLELLHNYEPISLGEAPIINLMWYWCSIANEDDALFKVYKEQIIDDFERRKKSYNLEILRTASHFDLVELIFSRENQCRLELKKALKEQLSRIKDELCPVGTIQTFAFSRIPNDGWLECDGREVDVADYPELFSAIGFTFGGNDSDKFKLPDLRGCFLRGWDHSAGTDSGRQFGSFQDDCLQEHGHIFETESQSTEKEGYHKHSVYTEYHEVSGLGMTSSNWVNDGYGSSYSAKGTSFSGEHSHRLPSMSVKGVQAINGDNIKVDVKETRPKNVAMLFCIKAKNGSATSTKTAYSKSHMPRL